MKKHKSLVGIRFGRLIALEFVEKTKKDHVYKCLCDCGIIKNISDRNLREKRTISCGCFHREMWIKNRLSYQKDRYEYFVLKKEHWQKLKSVLKGMKARSNGNPRYKTYYEKNITVCEEWNDARKFYDWAIINGYVPGLEIDRIDNNKGYYPENCRFVDRITNIRNSGIVKFKTINNVEYIAGAAANFCGICYATFRRWEKRGLTPQEIYDAQIGNNAK